MPLANQVHVDALLSSISVKYSPASLIGDKVFPVVPVKKSSDKFRIYDRNFRVPETRRADGAAAREHTFEVSTATYNLVEHALKDIVTDKQAENYDLADLKVETTKELTEKILMRRELDIANLFTTTSWSLNVSLAATAAFTANTTVSDPTPIFLTGGSVVVANSGMVPNVGILPRPAYVGCKVHTSILDRLKYTSADVDAVKLAALFECGELLIPAANYDTAAWGASASLSNFYGDVAWIGYRPAKPGPLVASSGYVFRKNANMVRRWRNEDRKGEMIEVGMEFEARVVASLSGYLIKDVT
jgi:hypothetical protein